MKKHSSKIIMASIFLVLFGTLLLTKSCSFFEEEPKEKKMALPVYNVDTASVELNTNFLGTVEGKFDVEIRPQVEGELQEAYVDEGDQVEKGQKLFKVEIGRASCRERGKE